MPRSGMAAYRPRLCAVPTATMNLNLNNKAGGMERRKACCYRTYAECFGFPSRLRISSVEIPPSDFCLERERSIKAINFGLLLKETVSISALVMLTKAATGLPSFVIITGSFLTFFV